MKPPNDANALTIGKLAPRGSVNFQTIRYYERSGLLSGPSRSPSGYRLYADDVVGRLRFIKQAKALEFSGNWCRCGCGPAQLAQTSGSGHKCEDVIALINEIARPSCEVEILDMHEAAVSSRVR